jgi:hypothetical protein
VVKPTDSTTEVATLVQSELVLFQPEFSKALKWLEELVELE